MPRRKRANVLRRMRVTSGRLQLKARAAGPLDGEGKHAPRRERSRRLREERIEIADIDEHIGGEYRLERSARSRGERLDYVALLEISVDAACARDLEHAL